MSEQCRFAPSTTGPAHPGTLFAGLLAWLDARSRHAKVVLRLEDLDPQRCTPEWEHGMIEDLEWFGLDWDRTQLQSELRSQHEAALDVLEKAGLLYPCDCSRARIKTDGIPGADGGWAYLNHCRGRSLGAGGWRACPDALRFRLPDEAVSLVDEAGHNLGQHPSTELGDPVVRRRDGAMAYNLAVVVDDAAVGVTRVVRGRDLQASTATQVLLQRALGYPQPTYRHHMLLLESHGEKLAKFHGAVGTPVLKSRYSAPQLCGFIAWVGGLVDRPEPITPEELCREFTWERVGTEDRALTWDGVALALSQG